MTRRTKLGGGVLALAVVCLGALYLTSSAELLVPLRGQLPRNIQRYFAPKPQQSPRMAKLPNIYLWAWERPEDLRFLGDKKIGVAFLAKTIAIDPPLNTSLRETADATHPFFATIRTRIRPRLQPLRITPGTPLMAVVRIESVQGAFPGAYANTKSAPLKASSKDLAIFVNEIVSAARIEGVSALQIDFDATLSEHDFYRDLLIEVRKQLPQNMPLSITALASWCIGDRWLEQLPPGTIDEAVPMLFRLGAGRSEITSYIHTGEEFGVGACKNSLGVSTDEPLSRKILSGTVSIGPRDSAKRIYVFSGSSWNSTNAESTLKEMESWHANF